MNIKKTANLLINFTIKRLAEIFGVIIFSGGVILLIALITYSPDDPNFIFPSDTEIKNILGFQGSFISDLFFQSVGLISYLISLTLIITGINIFKTAPKVSNSLEMLSTRLGPIHETLFERIHNVSVNGHVYNVAHTSKGLPPHNDFASYKSQPSIQALHMLENECEGGESIIVDGWKVSEDLRNERPDFFKILQEFDVPFREFDEDNETFAEAPIIQCSNDGSIESFRYSNQLMQMINPKRKGVKEFYKAYHEISARVHDLKYRSTFRLNGGDVLIVASHRVLHAREPFTPNGKRHLQDAYFVYDNAANNIVLLSN